jgi:hypothetical protein
VSAPVSRARSTASARRSSREIDRTASGGVRGVWAGRSLGEQTAFPRRLLTSKPRIALQEARRCGRTGVVLSARREPTKMCGFESFATFLALGAPASRPSISGRRPSAVARHVLAGRAEVDGAPLKLAPLAPASPARSVPLAGAPAIRGRCLYSSHLFNNVPFAPQNRRRNVQSRSVDKNV